MRFCPKFFSITFLSALLFLVGCMGPRQENVSAASPLSRTQRFHLNNLSGGAVSLDSLLKQNKAVLLNFWASWCPPCREEIPDLIKLQDKYKNSSFTVLGVDEGESAKKVANFIAKMKINYPVVLDAEGEVASEYGVVGIPTSFLISSDGKILREYHSASPELFRDVENALK